jgi:hypothetical protein
MSDNFGRPGVVWCFLDCPQVSRRNMHVCLLLTPLFAVVASLRFLPSAEDRRHLLTLSSQSFHSVHDPTLSHST